MKKTALFLTLAAFAIQTHAQFTVSMKVDIDNDSQSTLINNGGKYDNSRLRIYDSSFEITPSFGYELDEWEVGLELGFGHSTYKSRNYTTGNLDKDKAFSIAPSLYGRRNFSLTEKIKLFAECSMGLHFEKATDPNEDYDKTTAFYISLYPGMSYQLTDQFVLEVFFSYPGLDFQTSKTSYYDNSYNLVADGSSRTYLRLRPLGGYRDFVNGINFGLSYCF